MEEIRKEGYGLDEYLKKINKIPKQINTTQVVDIKRIAEELQKRLNKKIKI